MKGVIHEVDGAGRAEAAATLEDAAFGGGSQMRYETARHHFCGNGRGGDSSPRYCVRTLIWGASGLLAFSTKTYLPERGTRTPTFVSVG